MSQQLTAERVTEVFLDCLFQDGDDNINHVKVEGIRGDVGFHLARLESHKAEVEAMLDELPDDFKKSGGGGMSFLNACYDKHGEQWTGLHQTMEQLFLLGMAVGKAKLLAPREMWELLPGGMPYYVVS